MPGPEKTLLPTGRKAAAFAPGLDAVWRLDSVRREPWFRLRAALVVWSESSGGDVFAETRVRHPCQGFRQWLYSLFQTRNCRREM